MFSKNSENGGLNFNVVYRRKLLNTLLIEQATVASLAIDKGSESNANEKPLKNLSS